MTPAAELLVRLEARGVTLLPAAGGMLRIRPSGALTPEEREDALTLKREILDLLARRLTVDPWPAELAGHGRRIGPLERCVACRATTWATYAHIALCLQCATNRARSSSITGGGSSGRGI